MQLGHHGLHLRAVEHAHEDGLDHVVVVVAQRDLVAAQFPRLAVQVAAAHPGAQVAGILFFVVDDIENIRFKNGDGNAQKPGVVLDHLAVGLVVAGIHDQKFQLKGKLVVPVKLLKQLGHEHGILAAGNAYGDAVAGLDQIIGADGFGKLGKKPLVPRLADAFLDLLLQAGFLLPLHPVQQPARVAALQTVGFHAQTAQIFRRVHAELSPGTVQHHGLPGAKGGNLGFQSLLRQRHGSGKRVVSYAFRVPHVHQKAVRQAVQRFLGNFDFRGHERSFLSDEMTGEGYTSTHSSVWPVHGRSRSSTSRVRSFM